MPCGSGASTQMTGAEGRSDVLPGVIPEVILA
jgi:hypothetical protein